MMNTSSAFDKENVKGKEKCNCCSYCERAFDNYEGLEYHKKMHEVEFKRLVNQSNHFHNSMDISKPILGHGNVSMKTLYGATTNNPCVTKGHCYGGNNRGDHNSLFMTSSYSFTRTNNASLVASLPNKETNPFLTNGNCYGGNSQGDHNSLFMPPNYSFTSSNNASLVAPIPTKGISCVTKGNCYGGNSQGDHNSLFIPPNYSFTRTNNESLVATIPNKWTIPFSQYVNHPIYMGSSNNHIGHAPSVSSGISHQFDASNSQFFIDDFSIPFRSKFQNIKPNGIHLSYPIFVRNPSLPGYHMTERGLSIFPDSLKPFFVDTQTHSVSLNNIHQICERVKKHNRDKVQEKSSMMNPPKRPNINYGPLVYHEREMLQKNETLFSTKDAKLKDIDAIVFNDEGKIGSTSRSKNNVKEQEDDDLDLSLHL
ncbi:hypothetical protein D0Y65_009462 [Glycine soja]|uniref:C2H2-type domain-containing protein n=2 Tax=Glycine soja TaxID=3848 RepID=A0A445KZ29_GLYSO|nr:hypothetical protein D0Y65_009462 [Glycine soja]